MVSTYSPATQGFESIANTHIRNPMLRSLTGPGESFTNTQITGRTKNKFSQGFLGGCGSSSQFQGVNQNLPIMPYNSNRDLDHRIKAANGSASGTALQPSWVRSYAFNPGLGIDALASKITFTDSNAGRDSITGVVAPLVNAGIDRFSSGPAPPITTYQGLGVTQNAPCVVTGGEAANTTQKGVAQKEATKQSSGGKKRTI